MRKPFGLTDSPMNLFISFHKLIEQYEFMAKSQDTYTRSKAQRVLNVVERVPELKEGFNDLSLLDTYKSEISIILEDSFSSVLTKNEIKTASVPFENLIFNSSERFKNIIKNAGEGYELTIKNMPEEYKYIIACTIILNFYYGYRLDFKRPFHYEIPDINGIMRYYKIMYNADFTEITATDKAKKITQEDFDELIDNFDNLDIWKEKFPPNSYIFKGFVISNMFDVTDDQSISNIKSGLIADKNDKDENSIEDFHEIFRSLLNINDLKVGFSVYNAEDDTFEMVHDRSVDSFMLNGLTEMSCSNTLCSRSRKSLVGDFKFYAVSDVDKFYELSKGKAPQYRILKEQGFKSAILTPIVANNELLGVLELVSYQPKVLNSIVANKLIDVIPHITSTILRTKREEENLIEAIIQQECTSIEPSVYWKFAKEAKRFLHEQMKGNEVSFNQITFENVYPLFGQIDIKGSSMARNIATQKDLTLQLNLAKFVVDKVLKINPLPIYEQIVFQINSYLKSLDENFQVDSEQQINFFFRNEIEPLFDHLKSNNDVSEELERYNLAFNNELKTLYKHRKDYDETIASINKEMASLLDEKQKDAQKMYPHYFERFKTDGVEHNMYIGESITKEDSFNNIYLYNLRLWQLQVMCEMENSYYQMQSDFPIKLDVASMILVFNSPLSISFRMDEKRFDVDGTYNARYEIVKKRVDKAFIKGTNERVTQKGKISIVYSQKEDEIEYLRYIKFLQSKHYLDTDVEIVELQDLQAVTGLKAIRVSVLYNKDEGDKEFYTYDDLMKEIKA